MEENHSNMNNTDSPETKAAEPSPVKKKSKFSFTWILLIAFVLIFANIFRPKHTPQMHWLDYEAGIKIAQQQNKPMMLAFYKPHHSRCIDMWNDTYTNRHTIDFIEANFVPIYVDVDQQPDIAKKYEVAYYPMHIFITKDNKKIIKTRRGYDTPTQFMPILMEVLEINKSESE